MGKSESVPLGSNSFLEHGPWLKRIARQLVLDESRAEDVIQQSLLIALKHPPSPGRDPRPWLAGIVRNVARKMRRTEVRAVKRERRAAKDECTLDELPRIDETELRKKISRVVLELHEPYRTAVLLRFFTGLSPAQIAAQEKVPLDTVYKRIQRGLDMLRGKLDHEFGSRETWSVTVLPFALQTPSASTGSAASAAGLLKTVARAKWPAGFAALFLFGVATPLLLIENGSGPLQHRETVTDRGDTRVEAPFSENSMEDSANRISERTTPSLEIEQTKESHRAGVSSVPGRVVDARGLPLAGVRFAVTPRKLVRHLQIQGLLEHIDRLPAEALRQIQDLGIAPAEILESDARGEFIAQIDLNLDVAKQPFVYLLPGQFAQLDAGVTQDEMGRSELLVVASRAIEIAGRVVDEYGRAIDGARVQVEEILLDDLGAFPLLGKSKIPLLPLGLNFTQTESDGSFLLRGVPESRMVRIAAYKTGHAEQSMLGIPSATATTDFVLKRAASAAPLAPTQSVTLLDEHGQPLSHRRVLSEGRSSITNRAGEFAAPQGASSVTIFSGESLVSVEKVALKQFP